MLLARDASFVLASTDHGTLIVPRHDRASNPDGSSYGVGYSLLTLSRFEPEVAETLRNALQARRTRLGDGVLAIDVGANIGVFTLEMARFMLGWGEVIACEPQRMLFYALCGNVVMNNLPNAAPMHVAVGESGGEIPIPTVSYLEEASFGSLELRGSNADLGQKLSDVSTQMVRMTTIDSLVLGRVDLIKIDVEGMEFDVLAGAQRALYTQQPILLIEHMKHDKATLRAKLEQYRYVVIDACTHRDFLCVPYEDAMTLGIEIA